MRLTTKGRYAVTAMLDLAMHSKGAPVSLSDISERQGISLSYLEQLFSKLRQNTLVQSARGPGGGYSLARPPDSISIAEIISAVNESVDATNCGGLANCQHGETCLTHNLWEDLNDHIRTFLRDISLASLAARRDIASPCYRQDNSVADLLQVQAINQ